MGGYREALPVLAVGSDALIPAAPAAPDWVGVHRELRRRRGSSRLEQWRAYRGALMTGMGYSSFCRGYRSWLDQQPAFLQLDCRAGEWMLVDFWDYPVTPLDPSSPRCCIFVAMLGTSGYLFAEAPSERTVATWVAAHRHAFSFYGGVPRAVVLLRLQPWATNPGWPRQQLNPAYEEMARQHGTVILPPATFKPTPEPAASRVVSEISTLARTAVEAAGGDHALVGDALQRLVEDTNRWPIPGWDLSRQDLYRLDERPLLDQRLRAGCAEVQSGT
ncbi:MAG: hypothetical protein ACYCX9_11540 [Candidatus Dormibacteria bacterium]